MQSKTAAVEAMVIIFEFVETEWQNRRKKNSHCIKA